MSLRRGREFRNFYGYDGFVRFFLRPGGNEMRGGLMGFKVATPHVRVDFKYWPSRLRRMLLLMGSRE